MESLTKLTRKGGVNSGDEKFPCINSTGKAALILNELDRNRMKNSFTNLAEKPMLIQWTEGTNLSEKGLCQSRERKDPLNKFDPNGVVSPATERIH